MFKINNTAQFYNKIGLPKTRQAQYVPVCKSGTVKSTVAQRILVYKRLVLVSGLTECNASSSRQFQ